MSNKHSQPSRTAAVDTKCADVRHPPAVGAYLDYRQFLRDYYHYRKTTSRSFSYRAFARMAGINSHSVIKMVLDGNRSLSREGAKRLGGVCVQNRNELEYFLALVAWDQANTLHEKQAYWREVLERRRAVKLFHLDAQQLSLILDWRAVAIMEMTRLADFNADPAWIAERLRDAVAPSEVIELLARLLEAGVLREEKGKLVQSESGFFAASDVPNTAIQMYHHEVAEQGMQSLPHVDLSHREFSAATIALREEHIPQIKQMIRDFQNAVVDLVSPVHDADAVYQLNVQFFPVTQPPTKKDK